MWIVEYAFMASSTNIQIIAGRYKLSGAIIENDRGEPKRFFTAIIFQQYALSYRFTLMKSSTQSEPEFSI